MLSVTIGAGQYLSSVSGGDFPVGRMYNLHSFHGHWGAGEHDHGMFVKGVVLMSYMVILSPFLVQARSTSSTTSAAISRSTWFGCCPWPTPCHATQVHYNTHYSDLQSAIASGV